MNEHECVIGILYDYDNTDTVSYEELRNEIEWSNRAFNNHETFASIVERSVFKKFVFCPTCGKHIDWHGLKRRAEDDKF